MRKADRSLPEPRTPEVADLANTYLRDGIKPKDVSERLGVSLAWCSRQFKLLAPLGPVGWCGRCDFQTRERWLGPNMTEPCPECTEVEQ